MQLADDDFTLFGLPQRFALDRQALDACWRALQSKVHPDRFASEGAAAHFAAVQAGLTAKRSKRPATSPRSSSSTKRWRLTRLDCWPSLAVR